VYLLEAMKLTPLDIQQKTFRKLRLGGVDDKEVRAFLELCASEMEDLIRKLHKQDEELRRLGTRIEELRAREHLLQQTLTTAQKLTDELKDQARKESQIIVSEAELQAEKIVQNAQQKRLQLIQEIDDLKRARQTFVQQLASLLDTHKALLESARGDPAAPPAPQQRAAATPPGDDNVSFLAPPTKRADTKK
jgi:cell division initiation protein